MAIEQRAFVHARVDIGHAHKHADAAVGQLLGPLDLIEIARGVVVYGGPEQIAEVGKAVGYGEGGLRLNGGQFRVGSGRKVGMKTVLDHGGVRRGNQIEVKGMVGMHVRSRSWARNARLTRGTGSEGAKRWVGASASPHLKNEMCARRILVPVGRRDFFGDGLESGPVALNECNVLRRYHARRVTRNLALLLEYHKFEVVDEGA